MGQGPARGGTGDTLVLDLFEALGSSLELREILDRAFPVLMRIVPADYGALCVSRSDHDYDWAVVDFPVDWFSAYPEMAPHDFVRQSVVSRPNVVLRDTEMLSRRDLEANMMYRRAKDLGVPLEHVMSVMVAPSSEWHAGVNLYRGRLRPFTEDDRIFLQRLAPSLSNAVRNCKLFTDVSRRSTALESILGHHGFEAVVMASSSREVERTRGVTALVARWFTPAELDRNGLPSAALEALAEAEQRHGKLEAARSACTKEGPGTSRLEIAIVPFQEGAYRTLWALVFREQEVTAPGSWRGALTPKEYEVAKRVVLGWDNRLIADDLECELNTVKKYVQRIFDKLGVSNRSSLCHLATQRR